MRTCEGSEGRVPPATTSFTVASSAFATATSTATAVATATVTSTAGTITNAIICISSAAIAYSVAVAVAAAVAVAVAVAVARVVVVATVACTGIVWRYIRVRWAGQDALLWICNARWEHFGLVLSIEWQHRRLYKYLRRPGRHAKWVCVRFEYVPRSMCPRV